MYISRVMSTHWARVTHIWVSILYTIIGSDNGLSPGWNQAIIWTNHKILSIGSLGTNFSESMFTFTKCIWKCHLWNGHFKLSPGRWVNYFLSVPAARWGRVAHICVCKLTIIGSDNGFSPGRRQAIIWTNAGILFIAHFEANFCANLIQNCTFSFKKMHLKMSSGTWRPNCLGINVLRHLRARSFPFCLPCVYPLPGYAKTVPVQVKWVYRIWM